MFRSRPGRPSASPLMVLLFISVPLMLAGLFVWVLLGSGSKEGLDALNGGRVVTISLPSGMVQGGISTKDIKPAEAEGAATQEEDASKEVTLIPPAGEGLKPAPNADITEVTKEGPLPVISSDGTKAWQYYARAQDGVGDGAKIAVVVTGLGLSKKITDAALRLPPAVSLSFTPYVADVAMWAASARALGHEVLTDLPLEPADYPAVDPGPQALFTSLAPDVNAQRLRWVLSRFSGHIGVVAGYSERFTANAEAAEAPLKNLAERGMMLVLSGTAVPEATSQLLTRVKLPFVGAQARIEEETTQDAVREQLLALEASAQKQGQALLVIPASSAALGAVAEWAETLGKKGFILAPVSSLARAKFS